MILVKKQHTYLSNYNIGINKEQVVHLKLNSDLKTSYVAFKQELKKLGGVEHVSYCSGFPGVGIMPLLLEYNGSAHNLDLLKIDNDYFDVLKVPVHNKITNNERQCYINELADNSIGLSGDIFKANILGNNRELEIAAVIKDINFHPLYEPGKPAIYMLRNQNDWVDYALIRLNSSNNQKSIENIENLYHQFSVNFPFELAFMDDTINLAYQKEQRLSKIMSWFTLFAILISSLGVFILALYSLQQRTKEIGIRKVNGAKVSEILSMLNQDFIKWVVMSFFIASPIAYYVMSKWLESFAYKTELSWWIFGLAGISALGIALLTVSWQSWRAANRNPVEAPKYE